MSLEPNLFQGQLEKCIPLGSTLTGRRRFMGKAQSLWDVASVDCSRMITASSDGLHMFSMEGKLVTTIDQNHEFGSLCLTTKSSSGDLNTTACTSLTNRLQHLLAYNESLGKVQLYSTGKITDEDDTGWQKSILLKSFAVYDKPMIGWVSKVCSDTHGNVFVCDVRKDCIKMYTSQGEYVKHIGANGNGDGELLRPRGIHVDYSSGEITIVDHGNDRLSLFDDKGDFLRHILTKSEHGLDGPTDITCTHKGQIIVVTNKGFAHIVC